MRFSYEFRPGYKNKYREFLKIPTIVLRLKNCLATHVNTILKINVIMLYKVIRIKLKLVMRYKNLILP